MDMNTVGGLAIIGVLIVLALLGNKKPVADDDSMEFTKHSLGVDETTSLYFRDE